jgi:fatty acid desaturase
MEFLHFIGRLVFYVLRGVVALAVLVAIGWTAITFLAVTLGPLFEGSSSWPWQNRPTRGPINPYANAPASPPTPNKPEPPTQS